MIIRQEPSEILATLIAISDKHLKKQLTIISKEEGDDIDKIIERFYQEGQEAINFNLKCSPSWYLLAASISYPIKLPDSMHTLGKNIQIYLAIEKLKNLLQSKDGVKNFLEEMHQWRSQYHKPSRKFFRSSNVELHPIYNLWKEIKPFYEQYKKELADEKTAFKKRPK